MCSCGFRGSSRHWWSFLYQDISRQLHFSVCTYTDLYKDTRFSRALRIIYCCRRRRRPRPTLVQTVGVPHCQDRGKGTMVTTATSIGTTETKVGMSVTILTPCLCSQLQLCIHRRRLQQHWTSGSSHSSNCSEYSYSF